MAAERDLYALMGEISIRFANMEFAVSLLINRLISPDDRVVGDLVTENMTLSQKLRLILRLSRYRYRDDPAMDEAVRDLATEIDNIRETRNTFTHGNWMVRDHVLSQGFRCCTRNSGGGVDEEIERDWTIDDLNRVNAQVTALLERIDSFLGRVDVEGR